MTGRRVLAQTRFETLAVLRNGEQLLLTFLLPVIALVLLVQTDVVALPGSRHASALAGVLALAAVSTGFTSQAIAVAFDRRWGVLRLLATTPLGRGGLLAGKLGAVLAVLVVQVVVLTTTAFVLGWRPAADPVALLVAGALLVLGTACFTALGLLLGGTLRPEAVLAIANLVWVLLVAGGGLLLPVATLPDLLAGVVTVLPSAALGEGLRQLAGGGPVPWLHIGSLTVWTAAATWAAARFFRWD